jgi:hypothetical protein
MNKKDKNWEKTKLELLDVVGELSDNNGVFNIGMVLWGHVLGYPYWPSKLIRIDGDKLFVRFYGEDLKKTGEFAWVRKKTIKEFTVESGEKCIEICKSSSNSLIFKLSKSISSAILDYEKMRYANNEINEDLCYVCFKGGTLVLCDRFHLFNIKLS